MSERATGTFEVGFEPRLSDEEWRGRLRVTHDFAGDLTGTSVTQMVSVALDSGTGELTGLVGDLAITNDDGKHTYALDYTV